MRSPSVNIAVVDIIAISSSVHGVVIKSRQSRMFASYIKVSSVRIACMGIMRKVSSFKMDGISSVMPKCAGFAGISGNGVINSHLRSTTMSELSFKEKLWMFLIALWFGGSMALMLILAVEERR